MTDVLRYAAFTDRPGRQPGRRRARRRRAVRRRDAGDRRRASATARPRSCDGDDIRYFSPLAEVPFCGHATIATASRSPSATGPASVVFDTQRAGAGQHAARRPGPADRDADERAAARRRGRRPTSTRCWPRWAGGATTSTRRCRRASAYAGAWHPVLAVAHARAAGRPRLRLRPPRRADGRARLDDGAARLARGRGRFHSRNPFPPGGVVEDPATGAAAAALGAYLRELGLVEPPATITIHQGDDIGRPGRLLVDIHADRAGDRRDRRRRPIT